MRKLSKADKAEEKIIDRKFEEDMKTNNKTSWEVESVLEWMDNQIHHAEQSGGELKRSKERFVNSLNQGADDMAVSSIGWFVNDIQNITRNFRLDIAPDHAVRLHSYFTKAQP